MFLANLLEYGRMKKFKFKQFPLEMQFNCYQFVRPRRASRSVGRQGHHLIHHCEIDPSKLTKEVTSSSFNSL